MPNSVILVGGNLVSDTDFRKKLAGRDAGVELQMVVDDLLPRYAVDNFLLFLGALSCFYFLAGSQRVALPMTMSQFWLRKRT